MRFFQWVTGRQNSTYEKMVLWAGGFPLPFDAYLIRYWEGSYIGPHVDVVVDKGGVYQRHYRLNIILTSAEEGGEFRCKNPIWETKRIKFFRPDVSEHEVTRITKGSRLILSIGWVLRP